MKYGTIFAVIHLTVKDAGIYYTKQNH